MEMRIEQAMNVTPIDSCPTSAKEAVDGLDYAGMMLGQMAAMCRWMGMSTAESSENEAACGASGAFFTLADALRRIEAYVGRSVEAMMKG